MTKNLFYLIKALRPKQWIKNLFVFIPLIFGQELFNAIAVRNVIFAFILFSSMASAVYLFNDLIDINKDKLHPEKKTRPIASGKVSIKHAKLTIFILSSLSAILSGMLHPYFGWLLVFYFIFNLVYSLILKNMVIIDVFCVGIFYLLRIVAGTIVAGVNFSYWMILMIMLIAMFLGFNKRRQEIEVSDGQKVTRSVLVMYSPYFIDQMIAVITSTIIVSYMLYTIDDRTISLFGTQHLTYTIPFVYYGIFRYLYLVHKEKNKIVEDPTLVLYSDLPMQINLFLWICACIAIIYFKL